MAAGTKQEIKGEIKTPLFALITALSIALASVSPADAEDRAEDGDVLVLVMGDSLSAGYNLPPDASFPARLEVWLNTQGLSATIINAGVSGDTSTGGRARLDWVLSNLPVEDLDLVILEFGGNDMLRGTEPSVTRTNLAAMIATLIERNIPVLLAGIRALPNMGRDYEAEFNGLYPELAQEYGIPLYPFFLEGVATVPELKLGDGLHPNEAGVEVMVANMGPMILDFLIPAS